MEAPRSGATSAAKGGPAANAKAVLLASPGVDGTAKANPYCPTWVSDGPDDHLALGAVPDCSFCLGWRGH